MGMGMMMCGYCKHLEGATCRAFPDRITGALLDGEFDHRFEYPGDGGIRFEPRDEKRWQASLARQIMDGEIEDYEWMKDRYARRAAEVRAAAIEQP